MPLREFTDAQGTAWTAWNVPSPRVYEPPRSGFDRRVQATPGNALERSSGQERRRRVVSSELLHGWICFESADEKRRLMPPPDGWGTPADAELAALCLQAAPQPRPRPQRR
jgi:hypothetical protein